MNTINQSEFAAKACNPCQARENVVLLPILAEKKLFLVIDLCVDFHRTLECGGK